MELRNYQKKIIEKIDGLLSFGTRAVVAAATGSGKSVIISEITRRFTEEEQNIVILTNISELITQLKEHLDEFKIEYSVIKSGENIKNENAKVVIAMEQSFHRDRRIKENVKCDILIKDEYHVGFNGKRYKEIKEYLRPDKEIGFTATPIDERSTLLVPEEDVIFDASTDRLIKDGWLCKPKYYIPKWAEQINYSEIRKSGVDYSEVALREIIDTKEFIEQAYNAMLELDFTKKQTAIYCINIDHAENVKEFLRSKDIECETAHSKKTKEENRNTIDRFKKGELKIIISVSSLLIGFNAPNMQLLVNMRPTRVLRLWIQLGGRVLRKNDRKEYGEILDLGQCVSTLGFLEEPIPIASTPEEVRKELKKRNRSIIKNIVNNKPTEVSFNGVIEKIKELKAKSEKYKQLDTKDIISLYEQSDDVEEIIKFGFEIAYRTNGEKYTQSSIQWASEPWNKLVDEFPDKEQLIISTLKKMVKNKIKKGKKVAGIHYSANWLKNESDIAWMFKDYRQKDYDVYDDDEIPF